MRVPRWLRRLRSSLLSTAVLDTVVDENEGAVVCYVNRALAALHAARASTRLMVCVALCIDAHNHLCEIYHMLGDATVPVTLRDEIACVLEPYILRMGSRIEAFFERRANREADHLVDSISAAVGTCA
jgi:hypothetical protein